MNSVPKARSSIQIKALKCELETAKELKKDNL